MAGRNPRFEVIVVGAGPAGSTAALELARQGFEVLVIEKESVPRPKTCAGGLPIKVLESLGSGLEQEVRGRASGIAFTRRFGDGFVRRGHGPLLAFVDRPSFDHALVTRALEAGARLETGLKVSAVELGPGGCLVYAGRSQVLRCGFLVLADGAGGIGYRTLNPAEHRFMQLGLSVEVPSERWPRGYDPTIASVDWGTVLDSYGWVFCKGELISVGCVGPIGRPRLLRSYLSRLLALFGIELSAELDLRSWPMPTYTPRVRLARDGAVLAGDAAGMIDPLSGEGIAHAIASGRAAAEAIRRAAGTDAAELEPTHRELMASALIPEMWAQSRMRRFFAFAPRFVHSAFRRYDRLWQLFCDTLAGDAVQSDLRGRAPFAPLWPALDAAAWLACRAGPLPGASGRMVARLMATPFEPHPAISPAEGDSGGPTLRKAPPRHEER